MSHSYTQRIDSTNRHMVEDQQEAGSLSITLNTELDLAVIIEGTDFFTVH